VYFQCVIITLLTTTFYHDKYRAARNALKRWKLSSSSDINLRMSVCFVSVLLCSVPLGRCPAYPCAEPFVCFVHYCPKLPYLNQFNFLLTRFLHISRFPVNPLTTFQQYRLDLSWQQTCTLLHVVDVQVRFHTSKYILKLITKHYHDSVNK